MATPGQALRKRLQQCRETLECALPQPQVETLLTGWLLSRAWRDKGYCPGGAGFAGDGLTVMYPFLAEEDLAFLWEEWAGLWAREGARVKGVLGEPFLGGMAVEDIIALYACLQQPQRRQRLGAYYSPQEVVDFILQHTLVPLLKEMGPERVTFLDPACGCGHFLARAYDYFRAAYLKQGFPAAQIPFLILKGNLFGVDLDPWALHLAALHLLEKDRETWGEQRGVPVLNLLRTDALNKQEPGISFLIRPFSVVAGNPPHVTNYARRSQRLDQSYIDTLKPQYQFSRGRTSNRYNLAMFFLERFLELLEPGGRAGIVLDGSGFQTTVYREIRAELYSRSLIRHFVAGLEAFPGVNNRQAILIMERADGKRREGHRIKYRWGLRGEVVEIPQDSWSGAWSKPVSPGVAPLLAKIEGIGRPLGELYRPISGMNVTNRPEAGLKPFLSQEPLDGTYHKAVFSGNISPYILRWPTLEQIEARGRKRKYICFDRKLARAVNQYLEARGEKARVSIGRSEERFRQPKLFVRQSLGGDRCIAAAYSADPEKYCDNSVYVINMRDPSYPLLYLLAVLNSSLISFYAREAGFLSAASSATATRLPMGNSRGKGLRHLPIPAAKGSAQEPLVDLARQLVALGEKLKAAESQGDTSAVLALEERMAGLRRKVDEEVFSLYGLAPAQRDLIRRYLGDGEDAPGS